MKKQELIERLCALEKQQSGISAEIHDLKQALDNLSEDAPETLDFQYGETVYYLGEFGGICVDTFDETLEKFAETHMIFKSHEQAREFVAKVQYIADLMFWRELHDTKDFVPDWESGSHKPCIARLHDGTYTATYNTIFDCGTVYFSSINVAQECADWLNSKRLETEFDSVVSDNEMPF